MPPEPEELELATERPAEVRRQAKSERRRPARRRWVDLLKILFSLVVLTLLVTRVKPSEMAAAMSEANLRYLLLAVAMLPLNLFWQSARWWLLLKKVKPEVSFRESFQSMLVGLTLGLAVPGGIGGWGKIFAIPEKSRTTLLGLAVTESVCTYTATLFWGLPALAYFFWRQIWPALLVMALSALIITLLVLLRRRIYRTVFPVIPFKERAEDFVEAVKLIGTRRVFLILGISLLAFVTFSSQLFIIVRGFVDFGGVFLIASIFMVFLVKNSFPIGFGDLGTREGATMFFLGKCGISSSAALDSSLLLFAINMLLPALVGSFYLRRLKLRAN